MILKMLDCIVEFKRSIAVSVSMRAQAWPSEELAKNTALPPRGYQRAIFRSSSFTASTEAVIPYRFGPVFLASECWRLAGHQVTGSGWSILSA